MNIKSCFTTQGCKEFCRSLCLALSAALVIPTQAKAQNQHKHYRYKLTQVRTFGGPNSSYPTGPGFGQQRYFASQGATVGAAQTYTADPFSPNRFSNDVTLSEPVLDCFVDHALVLKDGKLNDLGALAGTTSSVSYGINVTEHAFLWSKGAMKDLGTETVDSFSVAYGINAARSSGVPAVFSEGGCLHAFLSENGGPMVDLNTAGVFRRSAVAVCLRSFRQRRHSYVWNAARRRRSHSCDAGWRTATPTSRREPR